MDERPPSTPVEQALVAAAEDPAGQDAEDRFLAVLLPSPVGVPGDTEDDGFAPMLRPDGSGTVAVAFTHRVRWERFAQAEGLDPEGEVRSVVVRDLFGRLVPAGVPLVLNPGSGLGRAFTITEMSDLLAGVRPGTRTRIQEHAQQVAVARPSRLPDGLLGRLSAHLRGLDGVESATLAWARYADGREGFLLGVRGSVARESVVDEDFHHVVGDLDGYTLDVVLAAAGTPLPTDSLPPFHRPS